MRTVEQMDPDSRHYRTPEESAREEALARALVGGVKDALREIREEGPRTRRKR